MTDKITCLFHIKQAYIPILFLTLVLGCSDNSSTDPLPEVEVSFTASESSITVNESISFTDQSTGNPTSWEWTFEGGDPAVSTDQNPTVSYGEPGLYDVTLRVTNSNSEDTQTFTDFIEVNCECSAECSEQCTPELLTDLIIRVDGAIRRYDVFLPSSHSVSSDLPVIIDLHGFTSDSDEQRSLSNFTDLAEENGIIMVWPEALVSGSSCVLPGVDGKYWNADWGAETDDVLFIDQLIDQLNADYAIDPKRIYVTGISNGGFMTYSIACALSDRIAAVTSVAGAMTQNVLNTECNPSRQIPVMHVHGTNDPVVFLNGDESCLGGIAAINDVVSFWRNNAGCSETFSEVLYEDIDTTDGSTAKMITYDGCGSKVQFLVVEGGGHNWPGSQYQIDQGFSILQPINKDINTTALIWEFFKKHQLP